MELDKISNQFKEYDRQKDKVKKDSLSSKGSSDK